MLVPPTVTNGLVIATRFGYLGTNGIDKVFAGIGVGFILGLIGIVLTCFLLVGWITGVILTSILVLMVYVGIQIYWYVKSEFIMSRRWVVANILLTLLIVLVGIIVGLASEKVGNYEGVSYSTLTLLLILWVYSFLRFMHDSVFINLRPVYYSPQIVPVFKYDIKNNRIKPHFSPLNAWILGMSLVIFWSFLTNVQMNPSWVGCVVTIGVVQLLILSAVYFRSITLNSIQKAY